MSRNIRTFADLGEDRTSDVGEDGSDGEGSDPSRQGQGFYVGSGQQVVGPNRNQGDLFKQIMESARARGDILSQGAQAGSSSRAEGSENPDQPVAKLVIWKNGYTIDNGPLRDFVTPENAQVLNQILNGQVPQELAKAYGGKPINVAVEKKLVDYEEPKNVPFSGSGARLGNVVPSTVESEQPVVQSTPDEKAKNMKQAQEELKLNESEPTTRLQIRLPSNDRIVQVFNQSHTLGTVRRFICAARPEFQYAPFQLMQSYPPKVIEEEDISLKDANLLNAALILKKI